MTRYCLETNAEKGDAALVHTLDCASFDLACLLTEGRIFSLGDFDNSLQALGSVLSTYPKALRCMDCCHSCLLPAMTERQTTLRSPSGN